MPTSPRWDPWVLRDGDTYRLFYLGGRTDQDPWWKTSWICGGTAQDWGQWQHTGPVLEPVLEPLAGDGWESGRIFAGSTYKEAGLYYLFYSAASQADIANEAIGLATSTDGVHWQRAERPLLSWKDAVKDAADVRSPSGVGYAGRCNLAGHLHWRDPYVIKSVVKSVGPSAPSAPSEQEKYYLFFCTSLTDTKQYQGGLGVAVSDRLGGPYRLLPPAAGPGIAAKAARTDEASIDKAHTDKEDELWPFYHLERPQVVFFRGQYHLFFSCFKHSINPLWLEKIGEHNVSDSTLYWYVSELATGPFRPMSDLPVVPGSKTTGLYGTTFFPLAAGGDWSQVAKMNDAAASLELAVLGWYFEDYRLAIAREFSALWSADGLKIVAN